MCVAVVRPFALPRSIPLYEYARIYSFPCGWSYGLLTRSAAVNIPEYVTLGVRVCWVHAWGETAGLWDFLVFSSGWYCLTVFQNIYTSLHSVKKLA